MPNYFIPDYLRPTLERIASMSDQEIEHVRTALANVSPHVKPEAIVSRIMAHATSSVAGLADIVRTLSSMSIARAKADAPLDDFVRDTTLSARIEPEKGAVLEKRLKLLLGIESLTLSARAFDVQHEYEKVFRSARIITDIRPIFDVTGTVAAGLMIVHNLKVAYIDGGEYREVLFALDDADITELKKLLDRAELKTRTLEGVISRAGIPYFESKTSEGNK